MSQPIELSADVMKMAIQAAEENGISPRVWIEREIRNAADDQKSCSTPGQRRSAWDDFIGAAARLPKPDSPRKRTAFGEILVKKYRKQGLKLDYDSD